MLKSGTGIGTSVSKCKWKSSERGDQDIEASDRHETQRNGEVRGWIEGSLAPGGTEQNLRVPLNEGSLETRLVTLAAARNYETRK